MRASSSANHSLRMQARVISRLIGELSVVGAEGTLMGGWVDCASALQAGGRQDIGHGDGDERRDKTSGPTVTVRQIRDSVTRTGAVVGYRGVSPRDTRYTTCANLHRVRLQEPSLKSLHTLWVNSHALPLSHLPRL